jgi:hypothetical protein
VDCHAPFPGHEGLQHRPYGDAPDIRNHSGQLDRGIFSHGLQAVDGPRPALYQRRAVSRQLPELPLGFGGHEAPPYEAVAEPFGHPFGILDSRFAAGDRFDMLGIDDQ